MKQLLLISFIAFSSLLSAQTNLQDSLDQNVPIVELVKSFPIDSFYCKNYCGGDHSGMSGKLIIN